MYFWKKGNKNNCDSGEDTDGVVRGERTKQNGSGTTNKRHNQGHRSHYAPDTADTRYNYSDYSIENLGDILGNAEEEFKEDGKTLLDQF